MSKNSKMMETALRVLQTMGQLGVVPMPRNYEVFYAAVTGGMPKLGGALMALGQSPKQEDIDEVANKFFPERMGESAAQRVTGKMGRELSVLSSTLDHEQRSLRAFDGAMNAARANLQQANKRGHIPQDKVMEFVEVVIHALSDRQEQGGRVAEKVSNTTSQVKDLQQEVEHYKMIANTDAMSKLFNRRAFDDRLAAVYSARKDGDAALIVMDIDRFKKINDSFGHPVGDMVIASVAERIKAVTRNGTFVARTGGEEFAVLIDNTNNRETLSMIAERIRAGIEALDLKIPKTNKPIGKVTVSLGVCEAVCADDPADLYEKADKALYQAKEAGRNKVVFHEAPVLQEDYDADQSRYLLYKN